MATQRHVTSSLFGQNVRLSYDSQQKKGTPLTSSYLKVMPTRRWDTETKVYRRAGRDSNSHAL